MVIVDAGHGGSDPGSSSGDIIEKDYTLKFLITCIIGLKNSEYQRL